jgi:Phosphodiester glycosidase
MLAAVLPAAVAGGLWGLYGAVTARAEVLEHDVVPGVRYLCRQTTPGFGRGWAHVTKTDLSHTGVGLFVSRSANTGDGFGYRLRAVDEVASAEGLTVAMNGPLFGSVSDLRGKVQRPGDLARSTERVISEREVGAMGVDVRLVWFERIAEGGWRGHWCDPRSQPPEVADHAVYGVGVQNSQLTAGKYDWAPDDAADRRSAIGLDESGLTLFLAVFENASLKQVADTLRAEGASDVVCVDGGHSSALVVGGKVVTGNWRPVAVTLGVKTAPSR